MHTHFKRERAGGEIESERYIRCSGSVLAQLAIATWLESHDYDDDG